LVLLALITASANKNNVKIKNFYINSYNKEAVMAIKPIGDRVLVEPLEDEINKVGSLYVPDTAKEKPQRGKIVAVGEGRLDGKDLIPMRVKVGDKVLFGKYAGVELKYEDKEYLILNEHDILVVID
jgi:chaperonin GroES